MRSADVREAWSRFWFCDDAPLNLAIARVLLAASALWVVLSRPRLPSLIGFPVLWETVPVARRIRFLLIENAGVEHALWVLLHIVLMLALFGIASRWSCLASAVLLYHFAPMETMFRNGNPYLRGFTLPVIGFVILAASASAGRLRASPPAGWQHRWPLALMQCVIASLYVFAAYSKVVTSGFAWVQPVNIHNYLLAIGQMDGSTTPLSLAIARHPLLCGVTAVGGILLECAVPAALFSRRAALMLVPVLVLFHIANGVLFDIMFQNLPLVLILVDWQSLRGARTMPSWTH
jgi:hypothetical protein